MKVGQRLLRAGFFTCVLMWTGLCGAASSQTPLVDAQAIETAQQYQIPAVPAHGSVAGPFAGPEGSVYYLNRQGLMTFYLPSGNAGYLARQGSPLVFLYGFNVTGYYRFTPQGPVKLTDPGVMMPWPHAVAIANVVVARFHRERLPAGQSATAIADHVAFPQPLVNTDALGSLSELSARQHQTMMDVLHNLGSEACTRHYDGTYYLGCW